MTPSIGATDLRWVTDYVLDPNFNISTGAGIRNRLSQPSLPLSCPLLLHTALFKILKGLPPRAPARHKAFRCQGL